jgi:RHS repeat-associated protein
VVKKSPSFFYTTASGRSQQIMSFSSLSEAWAEVRAKYETMNNPTATYEISNLRPEPGYVLYNGQIAASYMWDVKRTTPLGVDYSSTREIMTSRYCEQDSDKPKMQWELGEDLAKNGLTWCQRVVSDQVLMPSLAPVSRSCKAVEFKDGFFSAGGFVSNPIVPFTGEKIQIETDHSSSAADGLDLVRIFKTSWIKGSDNKKSGLGVAWRHNHYAYLKLMDENTLHADLPGGERRIFVRDTNGSNGPWRLLNGSDTFFENGEGFTLRLATDGTEYFFRRGMLELVTRINGWKTSYFYDDTGHLLLVKNNFGRSLNFYYGDEGLLSSFSSSEGVTVNYSFGGGGQLESVAYADGGIRKYHYESGFDPNYLTGISLGSQRFATYSYDGGGLAVESSHSGDAEKYTFSYAALGVSAAVTDPLGRTRNYGYGTKKGYMAVTSSNAPSSDGRADASARSQNAAGLVDWERDFNNNSTTYEWDVARRLPISVTQAQNKPEARTTGMTWHPQLPLPLKIAEPGRTTEYAYDGQGNPVTQTVTDLVGGSSTTRTTTWGYNGAGLLAQETAPNGAATSYLYDALGNLTQRTNALGHVDSYTHDTAGRVLTHTAPNGLVTTYTYDARGRVLTSSRGGLTNTFTYYLSGEILTASTSSGHTMSYGYDGARRLNAWSDNRGNSGTFVLDPMGNRLSEQVLNGQGQPVWQLARSINSLNRVQNTSVGTQSVTYGYDQNGDATSSTSAVGQRVSRSLDGLRRVTAVQQAEYRPSSSIAYNALGGVTSVTDPNGVTTTYTRDALGNATSETSPDSGSTSAQYDALGLPRTVTNALGQATTITRDLLGRPTSIVHAGGTITLRYDQGTSSKGYLSEIEDNSGTTTYQRDAQGRVISQTQKLINNDTRTLAYSYSATTGLLTSTTYPGGQTLQHVYDATGQLTGLTWAGQPLVSGITWSPLGQPTGWSWNLPGGAATIPATRTYNTAGQVTSTEFSSYTYDAAGRITSLTQSLMKPASTDPQAGTVSQTLATWVVAYGPTGRITYFGKPETPGLPLEGITYTYDENGNRLGSVVRRPDFISSRDYTITDNRQTGFRQTAISNGNWATTNITYQYNAAGDLLSDGLRTFQYDSQERLEKVTTGTGVDAPSTQYAHNALGQRVFKTEPLFAASAGSSGSGLGSTTSGKNLNNLLADPEDQEAAEKEKEQDKGLIQTAYEFFTRLWSPGSSDAQKLGFAYVYGTDGTLLGEYGMGGSNSSGTTQYIYLPTANGPMPIAAIVNGVAYAVHSDHLNTPRKLTQPDGQVAWQWAYSAFGDEQPTLGSKRFTDATTTPTTGTTSIPEVTFNLRYLGQYYDKESGLHYNYFRSYSAERGRYTQADPIGLDGGFNRFGYVSGNPLLMFDLFGLKDYSEAETKAILNQEREDAGAFLPLALFYMIRNHKGGGRMDFGVKGRSDTFDVGCGRKIDAYAFGNYIAGYGGVYFRGSDGYWGVRAAGLFFNAVEAAGTSKKFDWDMGSVPSIDAGATRAWAELAGMRGHNGYDSCTCGR